MCNGWLGPTLATPPVVACQAGQADAEYQQGSGTKLWDFFDWLAGMQLPSCLI
jgi:hypothetical protein